MLWASSANIFISGSDRTDGALRYEFPSLRLRVSASEGDPTDPTVVFFGVDSTFNTSRLDKSMKSHVKVKPADVNNFLAQQGTEVSFNFTLDDICFEAGTAEGNVAKFYAYKRALAQTPMMTLATGYHIFVAPVLILKF